MRSRRRWIYVTGAAAAILLLGLTLYLTSKRGPRRLRSKLALSIALLAKIEGPVRYARGGQGDWIEAAESVQLFAGDRLDTRMGQARITINGHATVHVNRGTVLRLFDGLELSHEWIANEVPKFRML